MTNIVWFPLSGSQETSKRLGYDSELPKDLVGVCCQEVYDIAWKYLKLMIEDWKQTYHGRMPHYDEIDCGWNNTEPVKPFRVTHKWRNTVRLAKDEIYEFYLKHLNRTPDNAEFNAALQHCQIKPGFEYSWGLEHGTEEYRRINYDLRCRDDAIHFVDKIEIARCVVCGEPIFAYNMQKMLYYAGEIEMSFGYGSRRDTSYGKGYIHDICSAKLDQVIFKCRLNWGNYELGYSDDEYNYEELVNLEKSEEQKEIVHYTKEEIREIRMKKSLEKFNGPLEF